MARMKSEVLTVGRPAGSLSKQTKLTNTEDTIREILDKKVGVSTIGRILGVNRLTVESYIRTWKLRED